MTSIPEETAVPRGDLSRQAVASLGGYTYQIYLSALAWAELKPHEILFLEIAEDFAVVARDALQAVQVKSSRKSLTLNSKETIAAIESFISLQKKNNTSRVHLVYHTAANAGKERRKVDRIEGKGGIEYWRDVQNGADAKPLLDRVLALDLKAETKQYISNLSLGRFKTEVVSRLEWRCGQKSLTEAKEELERVMVEYGTALDVHPEDCATAMRVVVGTVLERASEKGTRRLDIEDFGSVFRRATSIRIDNRHLRALAEDIVQNQPTELVDRELICLCEELRLLRFFEEFASKTKAEALLQRVLNGTLCGGSPSVRSRALGWCARVLYIDPQEYDLKDCLDAISRMAPTPESQVAKVLCEHRDSLEETVSLLTTQGSKVARSAALMRIVNEQGPEAGLEWFKAVCASVTEIDGCGMTSLLAGLCQASKWDKAFALADQIDLADAREYPALCQVLTVAKVARTAPDEFRFVLLAGVPFDAESFKLSEDAEDQEHRNAAAELLDHVQECAMAASLPDTARYAKQFALWLRLRSPTQRDEARRQLRVDLSDPDKSLSVVNLALCFGVEVDAEEVEKAIRQSTSQNLGKLTMDGACARLALILSSGDANVVANELREHRNALSERLDGDQLFLLEFGALCSAGRRTEAKHLRERSGERGEHVERLASHMLAEAEGADALELRLARFEETLRTEDLEAVIQALRDKDDHRQLADYAERLYERTHDLNDAKQFVRALDDSKQFDRADKFLDSHLGMVDENAELSTRYCMSQHQRGDVNGAWARILKLRKISDTETRRGLFVSICIASGRWSELEQFASAEYESRADRKPEELVRAGHLVARSAPRVSRELVEAAVQAAADEPNILAAAYLIASNSGWEEEPVVGEWLRGAIARSGETGPFVKISLEDFVRSAPEWNEREAKIWEALQSAHIPISLVAAALNRRQTDLTLGVAVANRKIADPRRRGIIPAFHGHGRSPSIESVERVVIDPSALLTLSDLGVLEKALKVFDCVYIPFETLPQLYEDLDRAQFHQPSRLRTARAVLDGVLDDVLTPLDPAPAVQGWLISQVGRSMARLLGAAKSVSMEGDVFGYVVHPGTITKPITLGKDPANLGELGAHVISCTTLVQHLRHIGSMSFEDASKAMNLLTLRGDCPPSDERLQANCTIFLDRLAAEYLVELGALETLRRAERPVYILADEVDSAKQLLEYEKRADQVKSSIERMRFLLAEGIESGRIIVGASADTAGREEELGKAGNVIASALQLLEHVDAFVCNDRAINKNLSVTNEGVSRPVISTLQLLGRLVERGELSEEDEIRCRHMLLSANYFFVPLNAEDLDYCLDRAVMIDGELVETAEMRALREYLAACAMWDWLQLPEEGAWLKQSQSAVRSCIWRQWERAEGVEVAKVKSKWLLELFDFRDWARFRPFEGESSISIRAVQLFLLTIPLGTMPTKARTVFLDWLEQGYIAGLRDSCPPLFNELVSSAKELIERAVEGVDEEHGKTIVAIDVLRDFPKSLYQALLQEKDLIANFSIPRETIVRIAEPAPHFKQAELYEVARKLLERVGSVQVLPDKRDVNWEFTCSDTHILTCTDGTTTVEMPELRYVASSRELRIRGFEALARGSLPKSAIEGWLRGLERGPLENADITALHDDVRATPGTVGRHVQQAVQVGSFRWNDLIPTDSLYCTRLVGRPDLCQTLESYLESGFRRWFEDLPDVAMGQAARTMLLACNLGEISQEASKFIRGKVDALEVLNWAGEQDVPAVRVAALEVFLPWSIDDESLRQPLSQLLETVVDTDVSKESSSYRFYVDLYLAIAGHVASGLCLREQSTFYRHLYIAAEVNILQQCFSASAVDTTTLARGMREDKAFAFSMRALVDMAEWPRWHTKYMTPEIMHADHLGRIWIAAGELEDKLPECELRNLLFGDLEDCLKPNVVFPLSYLPGPLEGRRSDVCNQSEETRTAINDQLNERPVSDRTFAGLITAGMTCGVFADQCEKAREALETVDMCFSDMEDDDNLWIMLDGLAQMSAQSQDPLLAKEIARLCRNHSSEVEGSIGYANALGIALAASAAIDQPMERFRFFGEFVEYFAFRELTKEECAELVGNLATICRVEPDLYPFLSKSMSALQAYMKSPTGR